MVSRVGILVPHLYDSQLAFNVITEIHKILAKGPQYDASVFFEDLAPQMNPPVFGMYNMAEIFNFEGTAIATSLSSADTLLNALKVERKIFYVWSLEWLEQQKNFLDNIRIYQNKDIELVTPSQSYSKALKNYCGRDSSVIENFDLERLI